MKFKQKPGWPAACFAVLLAVGCGSGGTPAFPDPATAGRTVLDAPAIAALIPSRYKDRSLWGEAILNALVANEIYPDRESACAVVAVIAQESGFAADPAVPGMAALAAERLDRYKARLGPVGEPVFKRLLAGRAPDDARTFERRLASVRTERDVDLLFRDMLAYYEGQYPTMFTAVNWAGKLTDLQSLAELNPITTAGSMQVSVRFAEEWAAARKGNGNKNGKTATSASVRESLYSRQGGVYYGTARLLGYPARYDAAIFRFADYNAGFYSSRNAALQGQLGRLTGRTLALDGDLLAYEKDGSPRDEPSASERAVQAFAERFAPQLSPRKIRRDLGAEKTLGFEETETYRAIKHAVEKAAPAPAPAPYAVLPQVAISSPKFAKSTPTRSTAWFAQSVDRRYRVCLGGSPTSASPPSAPGSDPGPRPR